MRRLAFCYEAEWCCAQHKADAAEINAIACYHSTDNALHHDTRGLVHEGMFPESGIPGNKGQPGVN